MIKNYDEEIEKRYHPENFDPLPDGALEQAELLIEYSIKEGLLAPEDCEGWTDEQKIAYLEECLRRENENKEE